MELCTLLVQCPSWGTEMPPLALGILQSALKKAGNPVQIRDLNIEVYHYLNRQGSSDVSASLSPLSENEQHTYPFWDKSNIHYWTDSKYYAENLFPILDPLLERFSDELSYGPWQVLGFSLISSNIAFANNLIERIKLKNPEKIVIVGGSAMVFAEERVRLRTDIDYFILGEGEDVLPQLITYLQKGRGCLPLGVYQTRVLQAEPLAARLENINTNILPDFSGLDLSLYTEKAIPLIFTRSCLFKCRFCADYGSMGHFRKCSSQTILQTLEFYYAQGHRFFWFNDLLINGIMSELCTAFQAFNADDRHIEWIALATPNHQLSASSLEFLAFSGLKTLNLGIESGSERVMRLMNKGFNLRQCEEALKRIYQAGIQTQLNVIVGFPGETETDFQETLQFLERNRNWICGLTSVNTCVRLPGSEIYTQPEKFGIVVEEGQDPLNHWCIPADNNYFAVRLERLQRILDWAGRQGFHIYTSNKLT